MAIKRVFVVLLATVSLASAVPAYAQSERGNITGVVADPSRAGIPGVSVKVINIGTNATTPVVTGEAGVYSAANLPPGTYRIEAALQGFQTANVEGIRLVAGATARVDVTLTLGAVSESVNVVAQNTLMQTDDAKVSTNISNELIDKLPLVVGGAMRSVFDLVSTVPEAKGSGTNVSLGGGQGGAFGATLDGISVNTNRNADVVETAFLTPSVEAITEFSVETNGFKPEFGQAGGGAITFASKSGTNEFHGSVYNFLRNDALDEKGFFEPTKGIYRQNNFGASLGGPVQIPGVYSGKNKTFFFAAYEGFMNNQASNAQTLSVPTPEMYDGDFSNWVDSQGRLLIIYDPATTRPNPNGTGFIRDAFPGNRIPANRFSTGREAIPGAGAVGSGAESGGPRAGNVWLRVEQLPVSGRHDERKDAQIQREDRPCAERCPSPVIPVQPDEQRRDARGRRRGRTSRFPSTRFNRQPSMATFTEEAGTGSSGREW